VSEFTVGGFMSKKHKKKLPHFCGSLLACKEKMHSLLVNSLTIIEMVAFIYMEISSSIGK
jgi:hypothetical protein